ncbi:MAG: hypothetical protein R3F14_08635 [Polyangiaceae bacterium]
MDALYTPPSVEGELPSKQGGSGKGPVFVPVVRLPLPGRIAVTIGGALFVVGLWRVPVVGVDLGGLQELGASGPGRMNLAALGLLPVILGYGLAELVALLVPSLGRRRHGGPDGRATIHRMAAIVALAIALFQANTLDTLLRSLNLTTAGTPTVVLSMTAGTFALWAVAQVVSRYGLGNGVVWLFGFSGLWGLLSGISGSAGRRRPKARCRQGRDSWGSRDSRRRCLSCGWRCAIRTLRMRNKGGASGQGDGDPEPSSGFRVPSGWRAFAGWCCPPCW